MIFACYLEDGQHCIVKVADPFRNFRVVYDVICRRLRVAPGGEFFIPPTKHNGDIWLPSAPIPFSTDDGITSQIAKSVIYIPPANPFVGPPVSRKRPKFHTLLPTAPHLIAYVRGRSVDFVLEVIRLLENGELDEDYQGEEEKFDLYM